MQFAEINTKRLASTNNCHKPQTGRFMYTIYVYKKNTNAVKHCNEKKARPSCSIRQH